MKTTVTYCVICLYMEKEMRRADEMHFNRTSHMSLLIKPLLTIRDEHKKNTLSIQPNHGEILAAPDM